MGGLGIGVEVVPPFGFRFEIDVHVVIIQRVILGIQGGVVLDHDRNLLEGIVVPEVVQKHPFEFQKVSIFLQKVLENWLDHELRQTTLNFHVALEIYFE
jgi:hypothetical protein